MITVWVISYNARAGSISSTLQEEMVAEKKDRIKKGEKEGERETGVLVLWASVTTLHPSVITMQPTALRCAEE